MFEVSQVVISIISIATVDLAARFADLAVMG
jgi:hypothetical protein